MMLIRLKKYVNVEMDRQVLIVAFVMASWRQTGSWNPGHVVNVALQTVYIAKFFWWETGYFTTLDITLDRAGYYICWGCLVWVPVFYTYSSYYAVAQLPTMSVSTALIVALMGNFHPFSGGSSP